MPQAAGKNVEADISYQDVDLNEKFCNEDVEKKCCQVQSSKLLNKRWRVPFLENSGDLGNVEFCV